MGSNDHSSENRRSLLARLVENEAEIVTIRNENAALKKALGINGQRSIMTVIAEEIAGSEPQPIGNMVQRYTEQFGAEHADLFERIVSRIAVPTEDPDLFTIDRKGRYGR